ncbi:MAG: hypothetical protein K0R63_1253 [Rickettsiales bacterium]|jgi:YggT family protein|nr:hypothetical protein [Rickettsiales bacterium]
MMNPLFMLLSMVLEVYSGALFVWIILTWLIHFNIINRHQPLVSKVEYVLYRLMEPPLRYIRRFLPNLGGIDLSPIVLFLLIRFLNYTLTYISFYGF